MKLSFTHGALIAASIAPLHAFAQSAPDEKPFSFHVSAGYSITTDRIDDYLENGWIVSGGVSWHPPGTPFSLVLDGHYSDYDATNRLLNLGTEITQTRIDDGDGSTLGADLNGVYDFQLGPHARAYVTAGIGVDRRRIELTQTILVNGVVCDPFWGFCGIGAVPGDVRIARDSVTRLAWNGGVGVEFPLKTSILFVDARYRRIETSRPTSYVPIAVGIRF